MEEHQCLLGGNPKCTWDMCVCIQAGGRGGGGGEESPPTREGRRPPHPRPSSAPRLFELLWHVRPLLSQLLVRLEEHPVRIAVVALLLLSRRHNRRRLGRLLEPSVWGLGWRVGVGVGQGVGDGVRGGGVEGRGGGYLPSAR